MTARTLFIALLPVLAIIALGCADPAAPVSEVQSRGIHDVMLEEVRAIATSSTMVPAAIHARQRATISSRLAASVTELPFRQGDRFGKGDVLVRLDDTAIRAAVRSASTAFDLAETDLSRIQSLLSQRAATPRELEGARSAAAAARAQLSAVREQLSFAVIEAPFAGMVASRPVHVGDVVSPGQRLLGVQGMKGMEIRATVEAAHLASIDIGQSLRVDVDGVDRQVVAIINAISPAGDPSTHRFELRADLPDDPGLRSGLFARVAIPNSDALTVPVVSTEALVRRGGLTGVFVAEVDPTDGTRARLRWIAVGRERDGMTQIRAGLQLGERIVKNPASLLDGDAIHEVQS